MSFSGTPTDDEILFKVKQQHDAEKYLENNAEEKLEILAPFFLGSEISRNNHNIFF